MITIREILDFLELNGYVYDLSQPLEEKNEVIHGFSSFNNYKPNTITWIRELLISRDEVRGKDIKIAIVEKNVDANECGIKYIVYVDNSKEVFFKLLEELFSKKKEAKIEKDSYISPKAIIGKNVSIGHFCTIDDEVVIGDNVIISDNVTIRNKVIVGNNVVIQPLCTIGEDGFGYSENECHKKTMIAHHGGVVIGEDVFIGSHVNIARGTIDDTIISAGVKIAPNTHIGHNVRIGENTTLITSKIYGSVVIGQNAYITHSVVRNQCSIGNNSLVGMGSVVTKNVPDNVTVVGAPAKPLVAKK